MPIEILTFGDLVGGYPQAQNGANNAIINDNSTWFLDVGKNLAYGDMVVKGLSDSENLVASSTIGGIEIILEDAGTDSTSTTSFDVEIFHQPTGEFSSTITTHLPAGSISSPTDISVGGSEILWGKSWTVADIFHDDFSVHLDNAQEPGGGIALISSFIYLKVHYAVGASLAGAIKLTGGSIILEGKLSLS